jgi:MazG family protein
MALPDSAAERLAYVRAGARGIGQLRRLLEVLRAPGGCPWDREQTHRSLAPYLIEETYEVLDALDSGDRAGLRKELGDLLLQIVFHAQIAAENSEFDLDDIAQAEVDKMVERHPHVFGEEVATSAKDVLDKWEARKRSREPRQSLADGVPLALPALTRAQTLSARAAGLGFDWGTAAEVVDKIREEIAEIEPHVDTGGDSLEEEIGDLLLATVNLARKSGLDAEAALRRATDKFVSRFDRMAKPAEGRLSSPEAATAWDRAWLAAKRPPR